MNHYLTVSVNIAESMKEESASARQRSNLWKVSLNWFPLSTKTVEMFPAQKLEIDYRDILKVTNQIDQKLL